MANNRVSCNVTVRTQVALLTPAALLMVALITCKLTGVIGWSWWWVLAPVWVPVLAAIALIFTAFVIVLWQIRR